MQYELDPKIEEFPETSREKIKIDLVKILEINRLQDLPLYDQYNGSHERIRRIKIRFSLADDIVYEAMDIAVKENGTFHAEEHPLGFRKFYSSDLKSL